MWKVGLLRFGTGQICPFLFNTVQEVASATRQEEEIRGIMIKREEIKKTRNRLFDCIQRKSKIMCK